VINLTVGSDNTIGYTPATAQHLLIDAGAIYTNYGLAGEKLLGATSGGNEFDVKVKTRDVKVDGLKGSVKGLTRIVSTDVTMKVNMLEVTAETLRIALMGVIDSTGTDYDVITGKTEILLTDYIDNIALVGRISGSAKPVVIMLKNALSSDGLKFSNKDSADNILPIAFTASIDPNTPTVSPYEIRFPKVTDGVLFSMIGTPYIDNGKVLLTLNDTVAVTAPLEGFAVTVAGVADVVTASTRGVNQLNTILLTPTTPPTAGQVVTVAYTKPVLDASDVKSLSGVALDTFAAMAVTNN